MYTFHFVTKCHLRQTPTRLPSVPPPSPALAARQARPACSLYTEALIKHSRNLRERSMSPTAKRTAVHVERYIKLDKTTYVTGRLHNMNVSESMVFGSDRSSRSDNVSVLFIQS